jgi:hypothetical protein
MDTEHIKSHTPRVTKNQCYKLFAFSKKRLTEEYNFYLSSQGKGSATQSKVVRYRDGFFRSSKGYETGPPQEFKDFVTQL